ncbi:hypothetical protein LTR17_019362 [Elasticomyces elasticus]|nr:hypothetical protein LTR17_019362 [Elasticomyces elasticus]
MSGLEVPAALELTVQIIALVETILKLWDTAKDARGLPKDMRAVADSLPLLRRTLTCAEEKLRADAGVEADVRPILQDCKDKMQALEKIFQRALPPPRQQQQIGDTTTDGDSHVRRLGRGARTMWDGRKARPLMESIDELVQRLAYFQLFKGAEDNVQDLERALSEYFEAVPEDRTMNFFNDGSGNQNVMTGKNAVMHVPTISGTGAKVEFNYGPQGTPHAGPSLDEVRDSAEAGVRVPIANAQAHTDKLYQQAQEQVLAERIMESLTYPEMLRRRQKVVNAHEATLEWVFHGLPYELVNDLINGLKSGSGIFWITGKPGSGKSTFMKFMVEHPKTLKLLSHEPGQSQALILSHFFWLAGSAMQNSFQGLLQNLLYQLLQCVAFKSAQTGLDHPTNHYTEDFRHHVIRHACVQRWGPPHPTRPWSFGELWECLNRAIKICAASTICIFVDGLDECQPDDEHERSLKYLKSLSAHPNVKLALSSRPWPIFSRGLARLYYLSMERITRPDMMDYVREMLTAASSELIWSEVSWQCIRAGTWNCAYGYRGCGKPHGELHVLVCDIISRADGVFLWLSLIVRAVCERLSAGRPLAELRRQVDEFPTELEEDFRAIVQTRISAAWASETAMALHLYLLGIRHFVPYWLLFQPANTGQPLVLDTEFPKNLSTSLCSHSDIAQSYNETKRTLGSCCKDLLQMPDLGEYERPHELRYAWNDSFPKRVRPIHRTVHDFLRSTEMRHLLRTSTPAHFQAPDFHYAMTIAHWKCFPVDSPSRAMDSCWTDLANPRCFNPVTCELDTYSSVPDSLVLQADETATRLFNQAQDLIDNRVAWTLEVYSYLANGMDAWRLQVLCCFFACHGQYRLISTIIRRNPVLLCSIRSLDVIFDRTDGVLAMVLTMKRDPYRCDPLIHMVLAAGADPNGCILTRTKLSKDGPLYTDYDYGTWIAGKIVTPWTIYLAKVEHEIRSDNRRPANPEPGSERDNRDRATWEDPDVDQPMRVRTSRGSNSVKREFDPSVCQRLLTLIQAGADLHALIYFASTQPSPLMAIDILKSRAPMSSSSRWPELLSLHSEGGKIRELQHNRRRMIEGWAEQPINHSHFD